MARQKARRRAQNRFLSLKQLSDRSAVFAFVIFLLIVFSLMDSLSDQKVSYSYNESKATKDLADMMLARLTAESPGSNGVGLIVKNTIDPEVLDTLSKMDYPELKSYLGVDTDFVIQLQSFDGTVIPIGEKLCIGSKEASVNGIPCG